MLWLFDDSTHSNHRDLMYAPSGYQIAFDNSSGGGARGWRSFVSATSPNVTVGAAMATSNRQVARGGSLRAPVTAWLVPAMSKFTGSTVSVSKG